MINILQLREKELDELQKIAREMGISDSDINSKEKDKLIYAILDQQAINSSTAHQEVQPRPEKKPRKRISNRKEASTEKVYTTSDKEAAEAEESPAVKAGSDNSKPEEPAETAEAVEKEQPKRTA